MTIEEWFEFDNCKNSELVLLSPRERMVLYDRVISEKTVTVFALRITGFSTNIVCHNICFNHAGEVPAGILTP